MPLAPCPLCAAALWPKCGGGAARTSHFQARRQQQRLAWGVGALDTRQEHAGGLLSHLERGGVDAGEPQRPQAGEDGVVEADQRKLLGDPYSERCRGGKGSDAGQVVGREDGGRPAGLAHKADRRTVAALSANVATSI